MNNLQTVGVSAVGGGLCFWGFTQLDKNEWLGLGVIAFGIITLIVAAILNKKGIPVGK
jgi:hypothetical protein